MRHSFQASLALTALALLPSAAPQEPARSTSGPAPTKRPNIILLLSDDQSWDGLSVRMDPSSARSASAVIETPNLARLAGEGLRFSRAYSPAPVCAPTRASLQTGMNPTALGWTGGAGRDSKNTLAGERLTFAELLQDAGYSTAHFGKWHLGGGGPGQHGYDVHDGDTGNQDAEGYEPTNPVDIFGMTERACDFIEASVEAQRPFFAQLSYYALHHPEQALPETLAKYEQRLPRGKDKQVQRAALSENLDTGVGQLLERLEALGIEGDTYVIYTSDNGGGGAGRNSLRGGKGDVWEGGLRVPFIVRGPGVAAGEASSTPVVGFDLYPTFAELAGALAQVPESVEGGSLVQLFHGASDRVVRTREELVFQYPPDADSGQPSAAILLGDRKLYQFPGDVAAELYDLGRDPAESEDLARDHPDEVAALAERLRSYLESTEGEPPSDGEGAVQGKRKGKRGRQGGRNPSHRRRRGA